jgi:hypothetical protein
LIDATFAVAGNIEQGTRKSAGGLPTQDADDYRSSSLPKQPGMIRDIHRGMTLQGNPLECKYP